MSTLEVAVRLTYVNYWRQTPLWAATDFSVGTMSIFLGPGILTEFSATDILGIDNAI